MMKTRYLYDGAIGFISNLEKDNYIIVTDSNLEILYSETLRNKNYIAIPAGEKHKNLSTVSRIYCEFLKLNVNRNTLIIGFGGGVVCDITGFVASTYYRGCTFGFVATSFMAMIDAAIGGKNGVNFENNKNIIGNINLPDFVYCDSEFLKTLPDSEYYNGIGELLKYTFLIDINFKNYVFDNSQNIKHKNIELLNNLIKSCVEYKHQIVLKDEKDRGERQKLNLGHSFAHIIELQKDIPHGLAVAKGIYIAIKISEFLKISNKDLSQEYKLMLEMFYDNISVNLKDFDFKLLKFDKKAHSKTHLNIILPVDYNELIIHKISITDLNKIITNNEFIKSF